MTSSYSIETAHGDTITTGIQSYEDALRMAPGAAERAGVTVYVVGTDEDGDDIQPEAVAPSVHVAVSVGSASSCVETVGAMDYDVTLTIGSVEHTGEITLVPGTDGRLSSWGPSVDAWVSGDLLRAMRQACLPDALWRATVAALASREDGPVTA